MTEVILPEAAWWFAVRRALQLQRQLVDLLLQRKQDGLAVG